MTERVGRNCRYLFLIQIVVGWVVVALPAWGQSGTAVAKTPTYDVVSIKLAAPHRPNSWMGVPADGFSAGGTSMKPLIMYAYNIKQLDLVSDVPEPVNSARFDVEAKLDEDTVAALKKLPKEDRQAQLMLMMQSMLADRFKLKVHREKKEIPIYALVITKGGFKLKDADPNNSYPHGIKGPDGISHAGMLMTTYGTSYANLTGQAISMASLALNLSGPAGRIVEDKTGLAGKYDVALHWSMDDNQATQPGGQTGATAPADTGPSIFAALQEQLGLRLESTKEMVDTIVIDHVEMPSEN